MTYPAVFQNPGYCEVTGDKLNRSIGDAFASYTDAITALAGGGATGAPLLATRVNRVSTVASDNDSVMMPQSVPGANVLIQNDGAHSLQVFANTTSSLASGVLDTLNGTAGATGIAVAAGKTAILVCYAYGAWHGPVALA
jgi:hypothetical protein